MSDTAIVTPARRPAVTGILPGLVLSVLIAAIAYGVHSIPGVGFLSTMILAIALGMIFHNTIGTPAVALPGVSFTLKRILRFAIILLGLQLTFVQVRAVGLNGLAVIVLTLVCTLTFTKWMGRRLGVDRKLAELIAAGSSICGASAVIATNTVTEAGDEDVAYAVACVTVFGSIAMFFYPVLPGVLHLAPRAFGLWAGASIHEIAQVVAAAFQDGNVAGHFATIAKLTRVMMMAPVVIVLGLITRRVTAGSGAARRVPLPWFVFGFIACICLNSVVTIPMSIKSPLITATSFMLTMALGAMGLGADLRKLKAKGYKPFLLGASAFIFVACFSLILVKLFA